MLAIGRVVNIFKNKHKNQLNKIEEWSRDGSIKKYTNKMIEQGWQLQVDIPRHIFQVVTDFMILTEYYWLCDNTTIM